MNQKINFLTLIVLRVQRFVYKQNSANNYIQSVQLLKNRFNAFRLNRCLLYDKIFIL